MITLSISMKVWDWAGIKLMTPGSTIGLATNCTTGPGFQQDKGQQTQASLRH